MIITCSTGWSWRHSSKFLLAWRWQSVNYYLQGIYRQGCIQDFFLGRGEHVSSKVNVCMPLQWYSLVHMVWPNSGGELREIPVCPPLYATGHLNRAPWNKLVSHFCCPKHTVCVHYNPWNQNTSLIRTCIQIREVLLYIRTMYIHVCLCISWSSTVSSHS